MRSLITLFVTRIFESPYRICWAVLLSALFLLGAFRFFPQADPDLFARVAVGEIIVGTGNVPQQDSFAFTPTKPIWHDHEWLISVPFYLATQWGGDPALLLIKVLFFGLTVFFILRTQARLQVPSIYGIAWFFVLLPDLLNGFLPNVRCQMVTFLGVALWLYAFTEARHGAKVFALWLLPLAMVFWANSHGGFVVGLGFSAVFAIVMLWERAPARAAAMGSAIGCALALLVNPYGVSYLGFIYEAALHPRPLIGEWGMLPLFSVRWFLLTASVLIVALGAWGNYRKGTPEQFLFIGLSVWQAYANDRLTPLAMIVLAGVGAPFAVEGISRLRTVLLGRWIALRDAMATVLILLMCGAAFSLIVESTSLRWPPTIPHDRGAFRFSYEGYPQEALHWLRSNRSGGNVLIHFNQASYALWVLRGSFRVAVDGRYEEVYPEETFLQALAAVDQTHPEHEAALRWIDPDFVVVSGPEMGPGDGFEDFQEVFAGGGWRVLERLGRAQAVAREEFLGTVWTLAPVRGESFPK